MPTEILKSRQLPSDTPAGNSADPLQDHLLRASFKDLSMFLPKYSDRSGYQTNAAHLPNIHTNYFAPRKLNAYSLLGTWI